MNWADKLVIPQHFSTEAMIAIKFGKINKIHDEIVNSLLTFMMVHTIQPTSEDCNTICARLIKTHPVLKDGVHSGYVWLHVF